MLWPGGPDEEPQSPGRRSGRPIGADAHAVDVIPQGLVPDRVEGLDFEAVWKWRVVEFGGDRLRLQRHHLV